MSAAPKSVASFIRRKLKIRGKTEHSGRGFALMAHSASIDDVYNGLLGIVNSNPDIIAYVSDDDKSLKIVFADTEERKYYRRIVLCKQFGNLYNVM